MTNDGIPDFEGVGVSALAAFQAALVNALGLMQSASAFDLVNAGWQYQRIMNAAA